MDQIENKIVYWGYVFNVFYQIDLSISVFNQFELNMVIKSELK